MVVDLANTGLSGGKVFFTVSCKRKGYEGKKRNKKWSASIIQEDWLGRSLGGWVRNRKETGL